MGLFGKRKGNSNPVMVISGIITCEDSLVMEEIKELVADTKAYFDTHREQYEERGIDEFDDMEENEACWLGMVDILEKNEYVCERDYKDEKEDFITFVSRLNGVKQASLSLNEDILDEEADVQKWCDVIDRNWEENGYCIAAIDIGSDSYVLFPAKLKELSRLNKNAEKAGYRICDAKEY